MNEDRFDMTWEKVKIKSIWKGFYDGPHATPPVCENGGIFLGISNITPNGHIDLSDIKYISEEDLPKWTKRVVPQEGDIVFSYEATLNLYAIIPEGFHGCLGRRMALIRVDEKKASNRFLFYYFFSKEWRTTVAENTIVGSTVDRIPIAKFPEFPITLPPLIVQQKIASILSAYDNLIENNNKRIKILEQMAENLYKEWFVRFRFPGHETTPIENGIPKGWDEKRLSDLIDVDPLLPIKKGIQVKSIPMEALSTDSMIVDENCIQLVDNPSGSHSQNGDTLVARITPCLENGKTGFVQCLDDGETATGSTEFIVLRSKELSPYYVYCFARSLYFRQTAILSMNGADGRQRVNIPKIKSMKLANPSNEIVKKFDSIVKPIFEEIYLLTKQNKNNIKQRDLLLPRLMNGKLAV